MTTARIIAAIGAGQSILAAAIGPALDFVDNRAIVRRIMVGVILWMLIDVYAWAKAYALRPGVSGLELAAVIAALTVPVTTLQGVVFRLYDTSRRADSAPAQPTDGTS